MHSRSVEVLLLYGVLTFGYYKWPLTKTSNAMEEIRSLGADSRVTNEKVLASLESAGSFVLLHESSVMNLTVSNVNLVHTITRNFSY